MPYIEDVTPQVLTEGGRFEVYPSGEPVERRHGIFRVAEAGLSPLDHGGLYGDACFEGILVMNRRILLYREHLLRLAASARKLGIGFPYNLPDLAWWIVKTVRDVTLAADERGYLRPVISRGIGSLGLNPAKCVAPTVYCIASTIMLYPPETYKAGIAISVSRRIRRPSRSILDPNIKSNNYLNNILALMDVDSEGQTDVLMLTADGFVAEATVENIFAVQKSPGWEEDPSLVKVLTPVREYCLVGITRCLVIAVAKAKGYTVVESPSLLPSDFTGPRTECFMTGTGCGLMPIVGIEGIPVGDGCPGPVTTGLMDCVDDRLTWPAYGFPLDGIREELDAYLADPVVVGGESAERG
jgi:branched-chain amino acid aminotransferase